MSDSKRKANRVLILEDHDDSREMLALVLRRQGFDVKAYDHCAAAEQHLQGCDIDIALLDVRLPDRCGDEFGKELHTRCPNTMIVFVTGEPLLDPLKKAVSDCFVIRKPVDAALLLELLECFGSSNGYGSPMQKKMDDRARGAKM